MQLLLDCMRRRENWPEEFISALEACEHTTMAAEIRQEYHSLRATLSNEGQGSKQYLFVCKYELVYLFFDALTLSIIIIIILLSK